MDQEKILKELKNAQKNHARIVAMAKKQLAIMQKIAPADLRKEVEAFTAKALNGTLTEEDIKKMKDAASRRDHK